MSGQDIEIVNTPQSSEASNVQHDSLNARVANLEVVLRQREDQIRILCGKLKGYETLGHLLHEAKQECNRYKYKNEELHNQLGMFLSQSSSGELSSTGGHPAGLPQARQSEAQYFPKADPPVDKPSKLLDRAVGVSSNNSNLTLGTAGSVDTSSQSSSYTQTRPQQVESAKDYPPSLVFSEGGDVVTAPMEDQSTREFQVSGEKLITIGGTTADVDANKPTDKTTDQAADQAAEGDQVASAWTPGNPGKTEEEASTASKPKSQRQSPEFSDYMEFSYPVDGDGGRKALDQSLSISTLHSGSTQGAGSEPDAMWKTQQTQDARRASNPHYQDLDQTRVDSSPESEELSRRIQALHQIVQQRFQSSSTSPLAVDITNLLHRAIRHDKQAQTQQVLLRGLTEQNNMLKKNHKQTEDQLIEAREEATKLLKRIHQLELQRDQFSSDGSLPDNREQSEPWIRVEKLNNAQNATDQVVMVTELDDQRHKVRQLQNQLQEVLQDNKKLEEFCKKQRLDHDTQLTALRCDLQRQDERRQREIDDLLLRSKKRAEELEMQAMEKQDRERMQHQQLQRHYENELQEAQRLQQSVEALRHQVTGQQEVIVALQAENRGLKQTPSMGATAMGSIASESLAMPTTAEGKRTEIMLLRQQIAIYKDDFDNERRDREHSQTLKGRLEEQLRKMQLDLTAAREENNKLQADLRTSKSELDVSHRHLQKKSEDLKVIQIQQQQQHQWMQEQVQRQTSVQPPPPLPPTANYYYPVQTPSPQQPPPPPAHLMDWRRAALQPPPLQQQLPPPPLAARQTWSCRKCTYENVAERVTCEMCGEKAGTVQFGLNIPSYQVPTMVEQYSPEAVGCQHHLIARSPYGRIECDTNRPGRQPSPSRQFTISNDPRDLVTDGSKDEERTESSLPR